MWAYYYYTIGIIRIRIYTQSHLLYWCRVSVKAGVFRMRVYIIIDLNRLWFLSLHPLFLFPSLLLGLSSLYSWPKVNITCSNMPFVYLQKIRVRQIIVGQGFFFLKHVPLRTTMYVCSLTIYPRNLGKVETH